MWMREGTERKSRHRYEQGYETRRPLGSPDPEDPSFIPPKTSSRPLRRDRVIREPERGEDLGRAVRRRCESSNAHLTPERDELGLELPALLAACKVIPRHLFSNGRALAVKERGDRFVRSNASDNRARGMRQTAPTSSSRPGRLQGTCCLGPGAVGHSALAHDRQLEDPN